MVTTAGSNPAFADATGFFVDDFLAGVRRAGVPVLGCDVWPPLL